MVFFIIRGTSKGPVKKAPASRLMMRFRIK